MALDELRRRELLDGESEHHFVGLSRREVVRRVGLACTVALPVITSLVAPTSSRAQSTCAGQACSSAEIYLQGTCCSGFRCAGTCSACVRAGQAYVATTCDSAAGCSTGCNSSPLKNQCCNTGTATTGSYDDAAAGGIQRVNCFCP